MDYSVSPVCRQLLRLLRAISPWMLCLVTLMFNLDLSCLTTSTRLQEPSRRLCRGLALCASVSLGMLMHLRTMPGTTFTRSTWRSSW